MSDEKYVSVLRHPCALGLDKEVVKEIADAATWCEVNSNEYLHRADETVNSLYLVIQGRLKVSILDIHGNESNWRFISRGDQFGALAAAKFEPVAVNVIAMEPSTLLEIDFQNALKLSTKYPTFQTNLMRLIGSEVEQMLFVDRKRHVPPVIGIIHQSASSRKLTRRLLTRLVELEETACILTDDPDWQPIQGVEFHPMYEEQELIGDKSSVRLLEKWANRGRIIIDCFSDLDFEKLCRVVNFSDTVLWCLDSRNFPGATENIGKLEAEVSSWREKISVVWLLEGEEMVAPHAPDLTELVANDFKLSMTELPKNAGSQLHHGIERIVHFLRGIRIGIALGGGGARGMAHLGVLKTLADHGIVVDMIAGTSAGAMTGGVHAMGFETSYSIEQFMKDLHPSWIFRHLPGGGYWYLVYKYRTGKFDPMLRKYFEDARIEQLPIPMHAVTVDLVGGEAVIRDDGDVVHGILESINLPVLSSPIRRPGQALVDGGLVNNVPANVLVQRGCNFVIAVSVTAKLEKEFAYIRPESKEVSRYRPSILQTIMRGYLVQNVNMNSIGVLPADVVIEPDVLDFGLQEFTRTDELAAAGARAAEEAIPQIKRLLSQLDEMLFANVKIPRTDSTGS